MIKQAVAIRLSKSESKRCLEHKISKRCRERYQLSLTFLQMGYPEETRRPLISFIPHPRPPFISTSLGRQGKGNLIPDQGKLSIYKKQLLYLVPLMRHHKGESV